MGKKGRKPWQIIVNFWENQNKDKKHLCFHIQLLANHKENKLRWNDPTNYANLTNEKTGWTEESCFVYRKVPWGDKNTQTISISFLSIYDIFITVVSTNPIDNTRNL